MPSGVYIRTEKHRKINSKSHKGHHHHGWKLSKKTKLKMSLSRIGKPSPMLGKHHSNKTKQKIKQSSHKNNKNYNWKGNRVSYNGNHQWIYRHLGKAKHCENCKLDKIPKGKKRWFQWANKSHRYLRYLTDWIQLCIPCHINYDKKYSELLK